MTEQMKIGEVAEIVNQLLENDKGMMSLNQKIDDAVNCVFEPDPAIKALPWVGNRHFAMTDIADARNAGARTFSTLLPNINIQPVSDDERDYDAANMAEQALLWDFSRMNRGGKSAHEKIVESALTYHRVCFEVIDRKHFYKNREKTPRVKALLAKSRFDWNVHHPSSVHGAQTDGVLDQVAKVACYPLQTLINQFGEDNPGIRAILAKKTLTPAERLKTEFTLVDYKNWTHRVQFAVEGKKTGNIGVSDFVFTNEEHGMPFLNWVIVDKGDPLWRSAIESGMWDNLQYLNLIEFAKAVEQSARSTLAIKTPDGTLKNVWLDFTNPSNPIVMQLDGSTVDNIAPAPIDPQLAKQKAEMRQSTQRTTVSSVLQDIGQFSDAPFSTVSQIVQMALGQLAPARNCAEDAEEEGFFQNFQWLEYTGEPLKGYYTKTTDVKEDGGKSKKNGTQIQIFAGKPPTQEEVDKLDEKGRRMMENSVYMDTDDLYISVELQANNTADEQSRLNLQIMAKEKLNLSNRQAWENMGWSNYDSNSNQVALETMEMTELQNAAYVRNKEIQDQMMQQATQQVQQQMQQQQKQQAQQAKNLEGQIKDMNAGSQMNALKGRDMRSGSQPAAQAVPMEGPNQITGEGIQ